MFSASIVLFDFLNDLDFLNHAGCLGNGLKTFFFVKCTHEKQFNPYGTARLHVRCLMRRSIILQSCY